MKKSFLSSLMLGFLSFLLFPFLVIFYLMLKTLSSIIYFKRNSLIDKSCREEVELATFPAV